MTPVNLLRLAPWIYPTERSATNKLCQYNIEQEGKVLKVYTKETEIINCRHWFKLLIITK